MSIVQFKFSFRFKWAVLSPHVFTKNEFRILTIFLGEDQREARSPSYFNPEEAAIVVQYVQDLLETKDTSKKVHKCLTSWGIIANPSLFQQ